MDDEQWSVIDETPNYEVSNLGRVRNRSTGRLLKSSPNTRGYPKVGLRVEGRDLTRSVHGLVARAFLEVAVSLLEPNHKDGRKTNNSVENLEWVTHQQNMIHAAQNGLLNPGHGGPPRIRVRIIETGEIFESVNACARAIDGHHGCILQCLDGRQSSHRGFTFERA
jgi:NUMOD4 motif/HNH endonuclease